MNVIWQEQSMKISFSGNYEYIFGALFARNLLSLILNDKITLGQISLL